MFRLTVPKQAYTRWKCDRILFWTPKYLLQDHGFVTCANLLVIFVLWRHFYWMSEETERKNHFWSTYPYWRDPIARRNEDKYKRLIRDNNIDITDAKWTGVAKAL
jgi:hypothetical protein